MTTLLKTASPNDRWTPDEHAEMALLVLVHNMTPEDRETFLFRLGIHPKEYEYLTEKYSRPLAKLRTESA